MKLTGPEIATFCQGYLGLEDCELDNDRGMQAAEAYAALLTQAQAFQLRQRALQKDRQRIVNDQAKKDRKGNIEYGDSPTGKPEHRPVLWKDTARAEAAFEAWQNKADEFDRRQIEVDVKPFPDTFFALPTPVTVKQSVRTAFLPLLAKQQAARAGSVPASSNRQHKRRKR